MISFWEEDMWQSSMIYANGSSVSFSAIKSSWEEDTWRRPNPTIMQANRPTQPLPLTPRISSFNISGYSARNPQKNMLVYTWRGLMKNSMFFSNRIFNSRLVQSIELKSVNLVFVCLSLTVTFLYLFNFLMLLAYIQIWRLN